MSVPRATLVASALLLAAAAHAAAPDEAAIRRTMAAYNAALNGGRTATVLPLYTADGVFMAPFSPSNVGIDAVRAAYDRVFHELRFDVRFTIREIVEMSPDYAFVRTNSPARRRMRRPGGRRLRRTRSCSSCVAGRTALGASRVTDSRRPARRAAEQHGAHAADGFGRTRVPARRDRGGARHDGGAPGAQEDRGADAWSGPKLAAMPRDGDRTSSTSDVGAVAVTKAGRAVTTAGELLEAIDAATAGIVEIAGRIEEAPCLRLRPGQQLRGVAGASIRFRKGDDGIVLAADNSVSGLDLHTDPERCAIRNDLDAPGLGRICLSAVRTTGCVRLIADRAVVGGHVEQHDVHVVEADARAFTERPSAFGVQVVAGVFTLWNRHASSERYVSAELRGVSVGRADRPVRGTGILVGGSATGGRVVMGLLESGEVHSDGGVAPGTADLISGGVFVLQGAAVDEVRNLGPVSTFGVNDMVLDNWGRVERWHARGKITSHGPNGIGFVNLGELGTLTLDGLLETHGLGACGFNCGEVKADVGDGDAGTGTAPPRYDGTVRRAIFERIVTRGDGAVGLQVAVPIGRVRVRNGIETFGGVGASLARGVVTKLAAVAVSVKPGGSLRELVVDDGLTTHGRGIEAFELHGRVDRLSVSGAVGPLGGGFVGV